MPKTCIVLLSRLFEDVMVVERTADWRDAELAEAVGLFILAGEDRDGVFALVRVKQLGHCWRSAHRQTGEARTKTNRCCRLWV
jgi:hypothetical protein